MGDPTVMIATPHIGLVDPQWFDSFLRLQKPGRMGEPGGWLRAAVYRQEVAHARNTLVTLMLNPTHPWFRDWKQFPLATYEQITHLFFWDDDMTLPADALMRLLAWNEPIVGGFYVSRTSPHSPQAYREGPSPDGRRKYVRIARFIDGLQEVDVVGAGCLLVKREVFEAIPPPWFTYECGAEPGDERGEDVSFMERARAAGYRILLDFGVQCGHIGRQVFKWGDTRPSSYATAELNRLAEEIRPWPRDRAVPAAPARVPGPPTAPMPTSSPNRADRRAAARRKP